MFLVLPKKCPRKNVPAPPEKISPEKCSCSSRKNLPGKMFLLPGKISPKKSFLLLPKKPFHMPQSIPKKSLRKNPSIPGKIFWAFRVILLQLFTTKDFFGRVVLGRIQFFGGFFGKVFGRLPSALHIFSERPRSFFRSGPCSQSAYRPHGKQRNPIVVPRSTQGPPQRKPKEIQWLSLCPPMEPSAKTYGFRKVPRREPRGENMKKSYGFPQVHPPGSPPKPYCKEILSLS
jgi:hypothetical protein